MNIQTAKKAGRGAIPNSLLINTLNRNEYLSSQVFNQNDYAKYSQKRQSKCPCGGIIPRDEIIFNRAKVCRTCKTKMVLSEPSAAAPIETKPSVRYFRLRRCVEWVNKFWHWRSEVKICGGRDCLSGIGGLNE